MKNLDSTLTTRRQLLGAATGALATLAVARVANAQGAAEAPVAEAPVAETPVAETPAVQTPAVQTLTAETPAAEMAPAAPKTNASAHDIALLQSALRVEQLQAAFYAQVLSAHTTRAYLKADLANAVEAMSALENAHVAAISSALGAPATEVAFKFPSAAFVSPIEVAWLGYSLEEIALGSHLHTLENLESKALRGAVVGIIASDSRHAALLRQFSGFIFSPRYFEPKFSPAQVNELLKPYLA